MKLLLLKIARVPLLLAAMLIGFTEIARGPAGIGADVYRDGDLVARTASLEAATAIVAPTERAAPLEVLPTATGTQVAQIPAATDSWSDRLRGIATGETSLSALARSDDDRSRRMFASAGGMARARATLAP